MKNSIVYLDMVILPSAILMFLMNSCKKAPFSSHINSSSGFTTINIQSSAYVPDTVRIQAGTTVIWTNIDTIPHKITDLGYIFNSGSLATNAVYQYTFPVAGTYTYHSALDTTMNNGVVIVTNAD